MNVCNTSIYSSFSVFSTSTIFSCDMTGNEPVTCQRLLSGQLYGMGHKELSTSTLLLERDSKIRIGCSIFKIFSTYIPRQALCRSR